VLGEFRLRLDRVATQQILKALEPSEDPCVMHPGRGFAVERRELAELQAQCPEDRLTGAELVPDGLRLAAQRVAEPLGPSPPDGASTMVT
jgi:hypothetical protein